MANRKRDVQILLWVTPEEKKMIRKRMILSKTSNMSVYLRKMAIDGMIVNTDTTYLKAMYQEMHKIGVNINQLAKVANTVGTATPQDIEELKEMVKKIWLTLRSFQSNLQRKRLWPISRIQIRRMNKNSSLRLAVLRKLRIWNLP